MARFKKLGEVSPGETLAVCRTLQLLTVFNDDGQPTAVIDGFSTVKRKSAGLRNGESLPVDENMETVFRLPIEEDWRYLFYLLDFASDEPSPISEQAIADIAAGSFFSMPLNEAHAESFGIAALSHPRMTVFFCRQDSNTKSFVVAVGPGPSD